MVMQCTVVSVWVDGEKQSGGSVDVGSGFGLAYVVC